jgi:hypothetical protein
MLCTSGWRALSHIRMAGLSSSGATTARVGSAAEFWIASSVATSPRVISGSA